MDGTLLYDGHKVVPRPKLHAIAEALSHYSKLWQVTDTEYAEFTNFQDNVNIFVSFSRKF